MDFVVPENLKVKVKVGEKLDKYLNLACMGLKKIVLVQVNSFGAGKF